MKVIKTFMNVKCFIIKKYIEKEFMIQGGSSRED